MTHRCAEIHDGFVKISGKRTNPNTIHSITEIGMKTILESWMRRRKASHPLIDCETFPKTNKRKTFDFSQCSSFFETKTQASVAIYPNVKKLEICTLMLITNLAEPEWLYVTCKKKLAYDVLCEIRDQNMVPVSSIAHRKLLCSLGSITVDAECFRFWWYNNSSPDSSLSHFCKQNKMNPTSIEKLTSFHHIFDAISTSFPPVLFPYKVYSSRLHKVQYFRFLNLFELKEDLIRKSDAEGFHVCFSTQYVISGSHVVQCRDGTYFSSQIACDMEADCWNETVFETYCLCTSVSALQYLSANGLCFSYDIKENVKQNDQDLPRKSFRCKSGIELDVTFKDDLVADCGPEAEDEPNLLFLLKNHKFSFCKGIGEIPCKQGHSRCYNTTDICVYKLGNFGNLDPCRNGGHLEQCEKFQCNMMFKCHNSYCIPWSYVCDGKWQCAFGADEMKDITCAQSNNCKFLFSCVNSTMCIHLGTTCDGEVNCLFGDDEILCLLKNIICPLQCQCLTYAIRCNHMKNTSVDYFAYKIYPHVYVSISEAISFSIKELFFSFSNMMFATLQHNEIHDICGISVVPKLIIYFNVGFNKVSVIQDNCLKNMWNLKTVNLTDNIVSSLNRKSFSNLTDLQVLCLSNNLFTHLPKEFLGDSENLKLLSMKKISSTDFDTNIFNHLSTVKIDVTDYHLCCLAPSRENCTSRIPWFVSCTDLFHDGKMRIIYIVISVLVLVMNGLSILLQLVACDSSKAYISAVISVNMTDILVLVYLSVIWIADIHYSGTFILKEALWRSSIGCLAAFCVALWFTCLSQLVLLFLSLSRMMVVIYPIDTRFKRTKFTIKCLGCLAFACFMVSISTTLTTKLTSAYLPTPICLPFFDPTYEIVVLLVLTWFITISQFVSAITIIVFHITLVFTLYKSQTNVNVTKAKQNDTSNVFLVVQLVIITMSNVLCWFPADTIYILAMFMGEYPAELVIWTTVATLPFNSVLNPTVFVGTSIRNYMTSK